MRNSALEENKNMRIDFHTHAIGHRYSYHGMIPTHLSPKDEADIRGLLNLGLQRGLDALGITDHDLALTGLWAAEYARENGLSLRIIPGCECELYHQGHWIHVLALNLTQPLVYTPYTPPLEVVCQIREQGAVSILAHPMSYSPEAYHLLKGIVDGMEYRNGAAERRGQPPFTVVLDEDGYTGLRLYNSDYHYPDKQCDEQWHAFTEMDEKEFSHWFGSK
jgi:hypothetical protein